MRNKKAVLKTYQQFCIAVGNQHIASEYAVIKIQELVNKFQIGNVLELGLGIGAIAGSLLAANKELAYTGIENNPFCLEALKENSAMNFSRINLYSRLSELEESDKYDLIIVDGQDSNLEKIKDLITYNGIIIIEGDRSKQQDALRGLFPEHIFVHSISNQKNKSYSPFAGDHWQGGIKVIFTKPDNKQKLWWGMEKIGTKLKYVYRRFRSN